MGAAPEKHFSTPEGQAKGRGFEPQSTKAMGASESPKISLATTGQKVPAWHRSVFNLDSGFRGLMLLAALVVLGIVALIMIELMQRSSLAWQKFGAQFFIGSDWDPVSGVFGALPFIYGTLVSSIIALI